VDVNQEDAEGEAMDLRDALAVAPGSLRIKSGIHADAGDCDIVVITAGVPQQPGESRMDLLKKNATIFKDMIKQIMDSGFDGIFIVVTNPMDVMTHLTWQYSDLPPERVIGSGTVLDSARLRQQLSRRLGVHPRSVHAYQVGEHGDSEFALWSSAFVGCQKITDIIEAEELSRVEDLARKEAYAIIEKKGATFYGIGACLATITHSILSDENRVLPVSNFDEYSGMYYGYPAVLGRQGIQRRLGPSLSEDEQRKLEASIAVIKQAVNEASN
jgi:L-lactate dehydrogenase